MIGSGWVKWGQIRSGRAGSDQIGCWVEGRNGSDRIGDWRSRLEIRDQRREIRDQIGSFRIRLDRIGLDRGGVGIGIKLFLVSV